MSNTKDKSIKEMGLYIQMLGKKFDKGTALLISICKCVWDAAMKGLHYEIKCIFVINNILHLKAFPVHPK